MSRRSLHLYAVLLTLAWAGFWMFFIIASSWSEPANILQKLVACAIRAGIILACVIPALANPRIGGLVLLLAGAALAAANLAYFHNPPATQMFLFLTLVLPPVIAGALLIYVGWFPHRSVG